MASDREFKKLRDELAELNRRFQEAGGEIDKEMGDRLRDYKDAMKEQSDEAWEMMRERGGMIDDYVQENPWKAAGIALGVGVIAGWILNNRREY